ncbi:MAG: DUF5519 family protein [Anaerolineales bacterium]
MKGAGNTIRDIVTAWEGVAAHPHRFGGTEFQFGTREIGHIHGEVLVDIPFPTKVRDEIITAGLAQPHHVLPESGWISFYIRKPEDVQRAIELFRRSYEIAQKQKGKYK